MNETNTATSIDGDMARRKPDFTDSGFRFFVTDSDYDYVHAKARCKNTDDNWNRALRYKSENEHDFTYDERDCTGSNAVSIVLKRKKHFILIEYCWYKDV